MLYHRKSHWRFCTILMLICGWEVRYGDLALHRSSLCEARDMSCEKGNGCRMKYYKLNSTDCRDMAFDESQRAVENSLGKVHLEPYHYDLKSYKQTGFNLTFTNISWNHFKFRFKQEGNDMKNTCREFYLAGNSTVSSLFYDCLWSNENYEGKTFSFEYQATNSELTSYKKYSFRVPFASHIQEMTQLADWEIFMLVEVSKDSFGLTTFVLRWQPLPAKFSVNSYNLKVYSNESGQDEVTYNTSVTCSDVDDCIYYYKKWYGNIQFGVQPMCTNDSDCFISKTAVFLLGGENTRPLLIGLVSVTAIVPAAVYLLYLLRSCLARRSAKWLCRVPKLLLISTPSLSAHVDVVFALAEYLKSYCHVEPLLDELHIFHSKSKDPFKWCNEAFTSADVVVVVASPYYQNLRLGTSIYRRTDALLLRLLRERLGARERGKGGEKRFCLVMLPYCSEKDIPAEAANLRRFAFPDDLNKLLRFIHRDDVLADCFGLELGGGQETYKLWGTKLNAAISEAQANLRKNRSEYESIVEEGRRGERDMEKEVEGEIKEKRMGGKEGRPKEYRSLSREYKSRMMELAGEMFAEFPGRLDDMNLSGKRGGAAGEEGESLMGDQRASVESDAINLDVLDL